MSPAVAINHINLPVRDLDRALRFFMDLLGFTYVKHLSPRKIVLNNKASISCSRKTKDMSPRSTSGTRRLDHVLLIDDPHLADLLRQYQRYFNESRPHQGIEQRVPAGSLTVTESSKPVAVTSVLGGLHIDYRRGRDAS